VTKGKQGHMVTWSTSSNCSFRPPLLSIPTASLYMAEKDATVRLRRAIKGLFHVDLTSSLMTPLCTENNLFLVKRLIQRTDMRNPDPGPKRYTSLAWAAVLGHEETFEFLLTAGHDDEELSRVRLLCCHKCCPPEVSNLCLSIRTLRITLFSCYWLTSSLLHLTRTPQAPHRSISWVLHFAWQDFTTSVTRGFLIGPTCKGKQHYIWLLSRGMRSSFV
jgi:hypothetical protein